MNEIESIANTAMSKYATAVNKRDVAAFIDLYAADVRIFDAWDAWEYRGTEQWRRPISDWLSSHPSERLTVTFDDITTHGSQTFVAVTALVTYARASAAGASLGAIRNRLTWCLQVHDGVVKIVHEHTSVPVDFHEMKPVPSRQP